MKVSVLVVCLAAVALATEVPRAIKEKKTVVEALPHAYETPAHFDESNGPFHFAELRSLHPIVAEKHVDSQQSEQVSQSAVTSYGASAGAPVTGQYQKIVKTVETSSVPVQHNVNVQQQVPVSSYEHHQIEKVEKVEKVEGAQHVEVPAATAYSGDYEHSAFVQKQPALATVSGVTGYGARSYVAQQPSSVTTYTKEVVSTPAVTTYVSQPAVTSYQQTTYSQQPIVSNYEKHVVSASPAVTTYTSSVPAASSYKKESSVYSQTGYSAVPAVSSYKQVVSSSAVPAVATYTQQQPAYSGFQQSSQSSQYGVKNVVSEPAVSSYQKESVVYSSTPVAQPAVSSYKQVVSSSAFPAVATYTQQQPAYSGFQQSSQSSQSSQYGVKNVVSQPAVSSYQKESSVYSQTGYSAVPAVSSYKQVVSSSAVPAVATFTQQQPAYSGYQQSSQSSYDVKSSQSSYDVKNVVSQPAVSSVQKESSVHSAAPVASAYKHESSSSSVVAKPAVFGAASGSQLYSQSATQYGGAAMYAGSSQQSAEGASSILKLYKNGDGTEIYQYGYATSNGINHDEEGKVVAKSSDSAVGSHAVTGSYSYTGPDGVQYTVHYIADENGFRAFGDHLPKLSEEQQRAIDEAAKEADQYDEQGHLKNHF